MTYWQHSSHPKEYNAWNAMKVRCRNESHPYYHRYGGRGIRVCEQWTSFEQFLLDMGPRPGPNYSLERRDNDQGYSKDNCFWATAEEQNNNRCFNRMLTAFGETLTVGQWATRRGMSYSALYQRIAKGWDAEDALTVPFNRSRRRPSKE